MERDVHAHLTHLLAVETLIRVKRPSFPPRLLPHTPKSHRSINDTSLKAVTLCHAPRAPERCSMRVALPVLDACSTFVGDLHT